MWNSMFYLIIKNIFMVRKTNKYIFNCTDI